MRARIIGAARATIAALCFAGTATTWAQSPALDRNDADYAAREHHEYWYNDVKAGLIPPSGDVLPLARPA